MGWFGKDDDDLKKHSDRAKAAKASDEEEEEETEDEEEEEEESDDTYNYDYQCDNCGEESSYDIPMGTLVEVHLKGKICESCGCNVYNPSSKKDD